MNELTPSEDQLGALKAIDNWFFTRANTQQVFLLDGGAGTGKSTVAGMAVKTLNVDSAIFGAYTARAARVMSEKGMEGAATLHSLLYQPRTDPETGLRTWVKLGRHSPCYEADLIIVDEVSMVNEEMAADLIEFGSPILVLGDVDGQLPPIKGRGAFTNRRPDYRLTEIHRNAEGNPIVQLAWRARGGYPLNRQDTPGARVLPFSQDAWNAILNRDYQVICGRHKSRLTVTRKARERFGLKGPLPQPGEPLVCTRNNYGLGFINGDTATIWRIREDDLEEPFFTADVRMYGEEYEELPIWRWPFEAHFNSNVATEENKSRSPYKAVEFDWAYALTAHKAQGSEFDKVIVIDDNFMKWDKDLRRRWLYTAITRAREEVIVYQVG